MFFNIRIMGVCVAMLAMAVDSHAANIVINGPLGGGGASEQKYEMPPAQKLIFEASNKFIEQDYKAAETLYSMAIQAGGGANAYVQRALVRRELNNTNGVLSDAKIARQMLDQQIQMDSNQADLYYQRSLANRLLKDFDAAILDLQAAMRIKNNGKYETDLKAIALERKMAQ